MMPTRPLALDLALYGLCGLAGLAMGLVVIVCWPAMLIWPALRYWLGGVLVHRLPTLVKLAALFAVTDDFAHFRQFPSPFAMQKSSVRF